MVFKKKEKEKSHRGPPRQPERWANSAFLWELRTTDPKDFWVSGVAPHTCDKIVHFVMLHKISVHEMKDGIIPGLGALCLKGMTVLNKKIYCRTVRTDNLLCWLGTSWLIHPQASSSQQFGAI